MQTKSLIVNADDYGLTEGISRGILRAHREGVVTSTSVLAVGPALPEVGSWLQDHPDLSVGVHLAATGEDPPVLSAREIPSLTNRRGELSLSWRGFLWRAATGRVDAKDLEREFTAQIHRVQELGVDISHVDTHQHLHLWPLVREVVLEVAKRAGIPAVRVPRSRGSRVLGYGVNHLARSLARRSSAVGLWFPGDMAGFDEAGRLDEGTLASALSSLARSPASSVELSTHPGEDPDPERARYRWGYRWSDELRALTAPATRAAIYAHGFTLRSYATTAGTSRPW
jgi:predicted glycoside hydrolase/deacetylase ChbG (UPF0249 family)